MSAVKVTSRLTRTIGLFTVSLVAMIPLMTLSDDTFSFLKPNTVKLLPTRHIIQVLVFGTSYAAIGELTTALAFSVVFMHALHHLFTYDGGSVASRYIKKRVVTCMQENVFSKEYAISP